MATPHEIATKDAWFKARLEFLAQEKEFTRLRDELSARRRALPRRALDGEYTFASATGPRTLADLFEGRSQLLVYHFMFGPQWEAGCPSCSFWADQFGPVLPHLRARDTSFAVISAAPLAKLTAYAARMGWNFPWVSAAGTEFNREFAVTFTETEKRDKTKAYNFGTTAPASEEMPGASAFVMDGDTVLHSYSTYSRGLDMLNGAYHWLDITARGRDEADLPFTMAWVKRHDEYAPAD